MHLECLQKCETDRCFSGLWRVLSRRLSTTSFSKNMIPTKYLPRYNRIPQVPKYAWRLVPPNAALCKPPSLSCKKPQKRRPPGSSANHLTIGAPLPGKDGKLRFAYTLASSPHNAPSPSPRWVHEAAESVLAVCIRLLHKHFSSGEPYCTAPVLGAGGRSLLLFVSQGT